MTYLLVDRPNPVTPQGTFPRRGGNVLSGTCIVHTSEGPWSNGVDPLTNFIRTRADYGSYHRACDWADIAVYFPWEWEAWQDSETNPWAVGIAAACRTTDWAVMPADVREGYYRNMGRMAADFVTYMRTVKGIHVPLKRITGAQARARVPGFCAHGDSGVARSDPGADFDWGYFFKCTQEALGGASIAPQSGNITPATPKEDTLSAAEVEQIVKRVNAYTGALLVSGYTVGPDKHPGGNMVAEVNQREQRNTNAIVKNLVGAIAALSKGEKFDEAKLLAGVQESARIGSLEGTKQAIESIDTQTTVTIKEKP